MRNQFGSARCRSSYLWLALILASVSTPLRSEPFAQGKSEHEVQVGTMTWRVQAYKAGCFRKGPLVVVFHGSDRNPGLARDNAIPLAEAGCALVVAPLFDKARFPRWAYQFGGLGEIVNEDGRRHFRLKPRERRTGYLVLELIDALRAGEGHPDMPYSLIGHSAGAQFLGRFAAFFPNEARRIVLANPGSYVMPMWERKYPYGFGGLPIVSNTDRKRYLASPVVVLISSQDTSRKGLDKSPGAERQGATRYERGHTAYDAAKASAAAEGLVFGWSLVEVPGLRHGSAKLYARSESAAALFGSCLRAALPSWEACSQQHAGERTNVTEPSVQ
jgi:pimeloyl-ACP methyl ester carboxylesterase